jgi:hypothetical protein
MDFHTWPKLTLVGGGVRAVWPWSRAFVRAERRVECNPRTHRVGVAGRLVYLA